MKIVCKFGGTSMADGNSIVSVSKILMEHSARDICVVSAPGKAGGGEKVTDLLIARKYIEVIARIRTIAAALQLEASCLQLLIYRLSYLVRTEHEDAIRSFGEYASAFMLANYIGWKFVDACEVVNFTRNGIQVLPEKLLGGKVVVPGYYGKDVLSGNITTFPRGGSDISGAVIASTLGADLYENWTDVSGVHDKNPRFHDDAKAIPYLSYNELRETAQNGAEVYHKEAIPPLEYKKIPLHILNTFDPAAPGTLVY